MKSREGELSISSSELGDYLGISQQSASRYLSELEKYGLIEKSRSGRGQLIKFTDTGLKALEDIYLNLQNFFEDKSKELLIEGKVISGLGEGAYYVREYADKLQRSIGFLPFFGTLNIRPLKAYPNIDRYTAGTIRNFKKGERTFGGIKYIPVRLTGDNWQEDCYLIMPKRTHHADELEIISRFNLREKFGIKDGDILGIEIKTTG